MFSFYCWNLFIFKVITKKREGVFLGKCVRTAAKTMVVDRKKKTEGTNSAIVGVETAAKYCERERCADRVRSRTDNEDEI